MVDRLRTLRQLDLKRITDEERKQVAMEKRREGAAKRITDSQAKAELERMSAILAAEVSEPTNALIKEEKW